MHLQPFRRGSIASSPTSGVVVTNSAVLLLCWVLDRTTHRNLDFLNCGQTDETSRCLKRTTGTWTIKPPKALKTYTRDNGCIVSDRVQTSQPSPTFDPQTVIVP